MIDPGVGGRSIVREAAPEILGRPEPRPRVGRDRLVWRMLLLADAIGVVGAFVVLDLGFGVRWGVTQPLLVCAAFLLLVAASSLDGLYGRDCTEADHTTADELVAIFQSVTVVTWLLTAAALALRVSLRDARGVVVLWVAAMALIPVMRTAARRVIHRRGSYEQRTIIVGAGLVGQMIAEKIVRNHHTGMKLVGFVDGAPLDLAGPVAHIPVLGGLDHLEPAVREHEIGRVMIAFSGDALGKTLEVIRSLSRHTVQIDVVPRLFEAVGPAVRLHSLEGITLVGLARPSRYAARPAKRLLDLLLAGTLLIVSAPVLLLVAVLVRLDSPGPALYRSERLGAEGRRFELRKFRTMRLDASRGARYGGAGAERHFDELLGYPGIREEFDRVHKLRRDPRVTRVGAWLRKTSLDELPQLVNVIRGDLSFVGPRPITADEFDQFFGVKSELAADRKAAGLFGPAAERLPGYWELEGVLPGITGYWQVTGRSNVGYDERLRLDWVYATSSSIKLDLLIMAKTVRALGGRNAF